METNNLRQLKTFTINPFRIDEETTICFDIVAQINSSFWFKKFQKWQPGLFPEFNFRFGMTFESIKNTNANAMMLWALFLYCLRLCTLFNVHFFPSLRKWGTAFWIVIFIKPMLFTEINWTRSYVHDLLPQKCSSLNFEWIYNYSVGFGGSGSRINSWPKFQKKN